MHLFVQFQSEISLSEAIMTYWSNFLRTGNLMVFQRFFLCSEIFERLQNYYFHSALTKNLAANME